MTVYDVGARRRMRADVRPNGCIRLRNEDVIELYDFLKPGSIVTVKD